MSPYERLTREKPTLHHIRVFGCGAFVYNESPKSKVHARAVSAIYLGSDNHDIFKCELLASRKIFYSKHVTFDEPAFPALEFPDSSCEEEPEHITYSTNPELGTASE